jgi:hypothetical protein
VSWSQARLLLVLLVVGVGAGAFLMYGLTREPDIDGLWATADCGGLLSDLLPRNDPLVVEIDPEQLTIYGKRSDRRFRLLETRRTELDAWRIFVIDETGETLDWRLEPGELLEYDGGKCRVTRIDWDTACEAIFAPRQARGGPPGPDRCAIAPTTLPDGD